MPSAQRVCGIPLTFTLPRTYVVIPPLCCLALACIDLPCAALFWYRLHLQVGSSSSNKLVQEAATTTPQEQLPQLPLPLLLVALQGSLQVATKATMQGPLMKMTCWLTWTWTGLRLSTGAHRHQQVLTTPCSSMAGSSGSSSHGSSRTAQAAGSSSSSNLVVTTAQQAAALQGQVRMASALATVQVLVQQGPPVASALQTSSNSLALVAGMALGAQHSHREHMAAVVQVQELAPAAMAAVVPAATAAMTLAAMAAMASAAMA